MVRTSATHHASDVFAVLGSRSAPTAIADSWRRCLTAHKLDPERPDPPVVLCGFELREARGMAGRTLRVADPELDRLHQLVASLGYAVFMTDAEGIMVARRVAGMDESGCRHWRLWPGAVWSEAVEGTNGVGTCLTEQRPITVHREQHFRTRHTSLTCTVSPLFDAAGRLAGALDISSFRPDPTGTVLPLVMEATRDAARRIEARCFRQTYAQALIISLAEADQEASVPLLALDEDKRVVGATRGARNLLGIDDADLSAGLALPAMPDDAATPGALLQAERSVLAGALATMQGNVSAAAQALGISRATMHRKLKTLGLHARKGVSEPRRERSPPRSAPG